MGKVNLLQNLAITGVIAATGIATTPAEATPFKIKVTGPIGTEVMVTPTKDNVPIPNTKQTLEILPPAGMVTFVIPNKVGNPLVEPNDAIVEFDIPGFAVINEKKAALEEVAGTFAFVPSLGEFLVDELGPGGNILVPAFGSTTTDLFSAVDLTEYIANPASFNIGDEFTISGGTSSLLSGFLFSSTPIGFDPSVGFITDSPINGDVSVVASQLITAATPEPTSTLSLLALGTLGAASTIKRKLKKSKSTEKDTTKVG